MLKKVHLNYYIQAKKVPFYQGDIVAVPGRTSILYLTQAFYKKKKIIQNFLLHKKTLE
jgi:hypothetical protein